jgi:WD40 repeat protein
LDLTADNPGDSSRLLIDNRFHFAAVAFSADSHWIAAARLYDATARILDLTADDPNANPRLLTGHQQPINSLAISANGRWIVTGSQDRTARIWDLAASDPSASPFVLRGHQESVESVAISPDDRWIVTGSADKTVRVWRWQWDDLVALGGQIGRNFDREEWEQYLPNEPYRKTFADRWEPTAPPRRWDDNRDAGEDTAFAGGSGGSRRRTARPGEFLRGIECEAGEVDGTRSITYFSPIFAKERPCRLSQGEVARDGYAVGAVNVDAQRFVHAVQLVFMRVTDKGDLDPNDYYVGEWLGTPAGKQRQTLTGGGRAIIGVHLQKGVVVNALALVVEGKARLVRRHEWPQIHLFHTAFSPDGRFYLAGGDGGALRVWDVATGRQLCEIPMEVGEFTPDGQHVVGRKDGKQILVFDVLSGKQQRAWQPSEPANSLAISPDGRQVLTGHTDSVLRLWDFASGQQVRQFAGHEGRAEIYIVFSADGKQILSASGSDKTVRLWDVETGKVLQTYQHFADAVPMEGTGLIVHAFFLPGGRQIAGYVWGQYKRLLVWDAASGEVIRKIDLGDDFSKDAAITSDGRLLVTPHEGNTVRIRSLSDGTELARCGMPVLPRGPAFSPDGRFLLVGGYRGWVSLWRLEKALGSADIEERPSR